MTNERTSHNSARLRSLLKMTALGERIETRGVIASSLALGALVAGATAGGSLGAAALGSRASRDAANAQVSAANHAAELQKQSDDAQRAYLERQANIDRQDAETTRSANYGQYAARQGFISNLGQALGLPARNIPAYVPLNGTQSGGGASAMPGSSGSASDLKALIDSGMNPQAAAAAFNQKYGRTTGNEAKYYDGSEHGGVPTIGLPDAYLSLEPNGWSVTPRSGGGSNASTARAALLPTNYTPNFMAAPQAVTLRNVWG